MKIEVNLKTGFTEDYRQLIPMQGKLKEYVDQKGRDNLKKSILSEGIIHPTFIWVDGQKKYIWDGHGRQDIYEELARRGYHIPPLPVVYLQAKNKADAKIKLLKKEQDYQRKITDEGLSDFITNEDIVIEDLDGLNLPGIGELDFDFLNDLVSDDMVSDDQGDKSAQDHDDGDEKKQKYDLDKIKSDGFFQAKTTCLLRGDCIEMMLQIPNNSVDMVLTDPPYGTTACEWDSVIPFELMWEQLKRIVKPNGAICLFGSEPFSSHLRMSNIKMFKYDWVWIKNFGSGFVTAKKMPLAYNELISVFYKKQCTYNPQFGDYSINSKNRIKNKMPEVKKLKNNIQKITYKKSEVSLKRGSYPKRHLEFSAPPNSKGRLHPTQKPVALLEYLIKTYTLENETVLDFTMGSGSTGVAAKNLNRKFIGIEQDDKYFEIAKNRIEPSSE